MDSVSKYFESLSSPRGVELPRATSSMAPPQAATEPQAAYAAAYTARDARAPLSPLEQVHRYTIVALLQSHRHATIVIPHRYDTTVSSP